MWASDKLNATLFDFKYSQFPNDESLKTIAHALHGASDKVIFLPTVKKSLLMEVKPNRKTASLSIDRIESYKKMMKIIIDETTKPTNGKQIVGMIPFIPWKFAKPIVDFYCSEGIRAFAIDAGFRDVMEYRNDFARVLSRIKETISLDKTVIFAFNAGIGSSFQATEVVSDDFLSVFAYVDVLGSTFKLRGGPSGGEEEPRSIPKARVFSRDKYAYEISSYPSLAPRFGNHVNFYTIRNYNKSEQRKETAKIRSLVGVEKMTKYLATKRAVNQDSLNRLESIAKEVG